MVLVDDGEPCSLEDLLPGTLFRFGDDVALKSEYHTDQGACRAYLIGSGEMFWGGTSTAEAQRKIMIQPLRIV